MTDSVAGRGMTISRYRSKRQKSRAISSDGDTAVSQSTPTIDMPNAIGPAVSKPVRAAISFETVAGRPSVDHGKTISTLQDVRVDAETRECADTAIDGSGNNNIDLLSPCSKRGRSPRAARTRILHSVEQSLNHPQSTAPRHQNGPPKSSEINATTVPKTRRVPHNDNEKHNGCFNLLRRGRRCRAEPACATQAAADGSPEHSTVRHICSACNEGTNEQAKASLVKVAESEVSGRAYAQGYHRGRVEISGTPHEPAKQDSVNYLARNITSRYCADLAMNTVSRDFDNSSPRSPYDMRHGAVQPQYFCTEETSMYRQMARQKSTQRRTTTSSIPSDIRPGTTLSTSPSVRSKPLIDLTPQYRPPPQHRHKGHGYYPEQLGSGKLVDYATSLKK